MAATVTGTERVIDTTVGGGSRSRGGNGFPKNGGGGNGRGSGSTRFAPERYRIGVWVAIGSILMLFVALTSAYIVRSASSNDWQPIVMPKVLWLSTTLIIISSITIERARRSLKRDNEPAYGKWLMITVALGI